MPVSFNPHSAPSASRVSAEVTSVDHPQTVTHRGISDSPSSITSYGTNGFFSWLGKKLGEIWESIMACFCCETAQSETLVETRIERVENGETIIDSHFDRFSGEFFSKMDARHSAIVVIIKYNDQITEPLFGKFSDKNAIKDWAKGRLHYLQSHDESRNRNDTALEIETFFIEKSGNSFQVDRNKHSLQFRNSEYHSSQKGNFMSGVSIDDFRRQLTAVIPSPDAILKFFDFVNGL